MKTLLWIAGAIVVALVLFWYFFYGGHSRGTGPNSLVGQVAPSFAVGSLQGGQTQLGAYRGKVVVMNLWASWCPPCRAEMPDLQRLARNYGARGVAVLGVDEGESAARASSFANSLGIHYPILLDRQQQYGRVYAALGLPTTIVVNRNGIVARGFDGPLSYPQMEQTIRPLLSSS